MTNKQLKELVEILKSAGVQAYKRGQLEILFKENAARLPTEDNTIRAISDPIYTEDGFLDEE
jgi:hypothetical protein